MYTYTLIAFDGSNNYSYPILLNASLEGAAELMHCNVTNLTKKDISIEIP
jgi:hypothetical protein